MYSGKKAFAKEFLRRLDENKGRIMIFVHESVDGDCIGSACGLSEVLKNLGYGSEVAVCEKMPDKMSFLKPQNFTTLVEDPDGYSPSLVIAVDCAQGSRMGICGKIFDLCENKLVVDHHKSVTTEAPNYWIVPSASSASELVFYLASELALLKGKPIEEVVDPIAAQFFLSGIVTDTGRFAYANTNPETLTVSGELMKLGAEISPVMYWFFDAKDKAQLQVSSYATANANFDCDGKIATTIVRDEDFDRFGGERVDIGEVVGRLRDVVGVKVSIVLRALENGGIRVNIRSYDPFDCALFAENYGGGGHKNAAGCTVTGIDIEELRDDMVARASEILKGTDR